MKKVAHNTEYHHLVDQIGILLTEARNQVASAANTPLMKTCWKIGQYPSTLWMRLTMIVVSLVLFVSGIKAEGIVPQDSLMDENFVKASIVVADPGDILYSTVGHVGLHMECPQHHLDFVFSYEAENVRHKVLSFLAGNLKMGLFAIPTRDYLDIFKAEGRGVRQYDLNLPIGVKQNLWRILDNHMLEGANLPYDYLNRGCAYSALNMLKEGLDTIPIHYGKWPETYKDMTRRELTEIRMSEFPWTWCFLMLISNGEIDANCSNEEKTIMPADLVYVLQNATVAGKPMLAKEAEILLPSNYHPKAHWCSPMLLAIIIVILTLIGLLLKSSIMDYVLLAIQTILGIVTVYLVFFSNLVCTEWSWLIIPFNPLPLLLWKWRRRWCLPYAFMIAIWILVMWLWPHTLTDSTYIVLAIALMVSYINIFRTLKPNKI